jgi:hypothetical protein
VQVRFDKKEPSWPASCDPALHPPQLTDTGSDLQTDLGLDWDITVYAVPALIGGAGGDTLALITDVLYSELCSLAI